MTLRGQTLPAVARVILQPLRTEKLEGRSPELKKRKRNEFEEKEKEVKQQPSLPPVEEEPSSAPT